jgi:WD40 repeat protein
MEVVIFDCVPVGETDEAAYEQLKLIRASDGVAKIVDTQLIYCGGLGAYGFKGLFWSPNSRYFYYANAREGSPDGVCSYWEPSIFSFEVTTGNKEAIGMGPRSPDGKKIAAWDDNGEIVVWDIDAGEVGRVQVDSGRVAGPIVWSPNSRALIYLQTTTYCPPRGKSYVGRIDLPDLQRTPLIESETPSFEDVSWDTPNRIRLFDKDGKEWLYDFAAKELKPQ